MTRYYIYALLANVFWSFSFIWMKQALSAYQPLTVVLFRVGIAAMLMLAISKVMRKLQKVQPADLARLALLSFFEPFMYFMGESYGLQYLSPTVASVIVALIPLFTTIAAWFFHGERMSLWNYIGLVVSFAGVALVVVNTATGMLVSPKGVALEFVAVLSSIGFAVVLKRVADRYNGFTIVCYQNLFGALFFLPLWIGLEMPSTVYAPFHSGAFTAIVLLAVFSSSLAFVFYTAGIRRLGLNRTAMFINIMPVFVAVFSYFIFDERLGFQKIAGIAIVISGLFIAGKQAKRTVI
ncbi:MAG: DMT family transporter [Bacteroidales bacterium]|jgi:drug/metabolite transporter (DMT)-like permease|nr:DMT family transporter [Bacteroidales bacterium]